MRYAKREFNCPTEGCGKPMKAEVHPNPKVWGMQWVCPDGHVTPGVYLFNEKYWQPKGFPLPSLRRE